METINCMLYSNPHSCDNWCGAYSLVNRFAHAVGDTWMRDERTGKRRRTEEGCVPNYTNTMHRRSKAMLGIETVELEARLQQRKC